MKRILITGGAGFIGSHLCGRLLREGNEVLCLDNLSTGSERNIERLKKEKDFSFISHDINDPLVLEGRVDEVFNLACPASPVHYQKDPISTMMTNVLGLKNVLDLAERKKARILQASTSEVYGDPEESPQKESYKGSVNSIGSRACYDEGKRAGEALCFDYKRKKGVDIRVVRIFNTYGPNMSPDDGRVVSNFIVQALGNKPITVYGDGSQTRSFCYVTDMVEGLIRMMASDKSGPVNLGNPEEYKISELAEKVISLTGSGSEVVYKDLPEDDPARRKPDISLVKELLGWEPSVPLEEGLEKTIGYFRVF